MSFNSVFKNFEISYFSQYCGECLDSLDLHNLTYFTCTTVNYILANLFKCVYMYI